MNYRHIYHAGNFADVVKHAALALCIDHLRLKAAPFRVVDAHAGIGRYDLAGVEAGKTLEFSDGIGRLFGVDAGPVPPAAAAALAPYLDIVRKLNAGGGLTLYPGSPEIAAQMLREDDRMIFNELHPEDRGTLAAAYAADRRAKVMGLDAWTALKALLPPPERRGLVLIDPPFEQPDEFERLAAGLAGAMRRFATGTLLLWYPVKDPAVVSAFYGAVRPLNLTKTLRAELLVRAPADISKLNGCGLFIVNPPWTLSDKLGALLPFLAERLARGAGADYRLEASV
ncbi:MAG: 23S rRNA (adenine(2030)-N(6))-methyltransferase RlmJ [Pseudomonadota bacterium]|nr:23S rRNA (adenine(2030)-N(6))-methyltransferase RlmJ [Pseudomonadota bacterium]